MHDDGSVHYPFSKFLTDRFTNPHTRELVSQSLRIFYRFCTAHRIELALRTTSARCLSYNEAKSLCELCWRPLTEVEAMSDKKVVSLTSAKAGKAPKDLPGAVEDDTALKRLNHIAAYINFYREVFIDPNIRSFITREQLKDEYNKIGRQLSTSITGTKQNHHLSIKSLPADKYLAIIKAVFARPEELFQSEAGKPSRTLLRDRAMALLACEGLRPGTLGNIALSDFRPNSGHLVIKDNRAKRTERVTTGTPKLKLGASSQVNSASETMVTLWPFTIRAIQDYVNDERDTVLMKRLTNRTAGFLFLSDEGEPIKHRSSITQMFSALRKRLSSMGLLDVGNDPYFAEQKKYALTGHVLRHSAASFFLSQKCKEYTEEAGVERPGQYKDVPDLIKDLMKKRFGWTMNSKMPELYAARALSERANVVLTDFNQSLLDEVAALQKQREAK